MSRSEAISAFSYDGKKIDREITADNARDDTLGLVFDSDPRKVARTGAVQATDSVRAEEEDNESEAGPDRESDVA